MAKEFAMAKGHFDSDRQLDALAHVIAKDDIAAVAAEWGICGATNRVRGARQSG
jgi:hypothetical protein